MHPSLLSLLLAVVCALGLTWVRPAAKVNWKTFLWGGLATLAALACFFAWWSPPGMSFVHADSVRVVLGALEDLSTGLKGADCVVVFDGSSSSAYALDVATLRQELEKDGHHPCIVSLVNHAGEHLEREWMAEELRRLMPAELKGRVDAMPLLWAKEMLWLYESLPMRFAAENRGSSRLLACTNPDRGVTALRALWTDWRDQKKNARLDFKESVEAFPADRLTATFNHLCFNLFQCGRITRLSDGRAQPLHVLEALERAPWSGQIPSWWANVPPPGSKEKKSTSLRPRTWFKELLAAAPKGWPVRDGAERLAFMQPVANRTAIKYSDLLETEGLGLPVRLLNGQADAALVEKLHKPEMWQDIIHFSKEGAEVFSRWLAARLSPVLAGLKTRCPQTTAAH